jgi:NAD(P)-dependent dehydrogenase (short-subunit alcohol dehydrogenase family)
MARISRRTLRSTLLALLGVSMVAGLRAIVQRTRTLAWRGKVVVITGGTRGLGLILAEELGLRGARIAVCGRDEGAAAEAERRLALVFDDVLVHRGDLGVPGEAARFIARVVAAWGRVDVLINNAGVIQVAPLISLPIESLEESMRSTFWSAAYTTFAALPHLRRTPGAQIVNVVSIGGRVAVPHLLAYSAAKFALQGFSEGLFAELRNAGIRVTTVVPGPMRTGSFYNAEFLGHARAELRWFSVGASLPIVSIDAHRAALRIIRAAEAGAVEIHLGLTAYALSFLHGVAPRGTQRLMALITRLLPRPTDASSDVWRGREVGTPFLRSILLRLGNSAAHRYNESPPEEIR